MLTSLPALKGCLLVTCCPMASRVTLLLIMATPLALCDTGYLTLLKRGLSSQEAPRTVDTPDSGWQWLLWGSLTDCEDVATSATSAVWVLLYPLVWLRNAPEGKRESWDGELGTSTHGLLLGDPLWVSLYGRDQVKISPRFADEEVEAFPRKIS